MSSYDDRIDRTVAALDNMDATNPETAHIEADKLVLEWVPEEIEAAARRLWDRCRWAS